MVFREVVASLYPWDLLDEGVEPILDRLEGWTRCNSTYLVALMHHEKRPLTDFYYPHNPRRKVYWTEDSRAYWQPNPAAYRDSRIKPAPSDNSDLRGIDWLQRLIESSRRRGMTTGAELSHTWIDKVRASEDLADVVQADIFGRRFDQQLCFNHPDVRAYSVALFSDLVGNYEIDFIQTCVRGFNPGRSGRGASELERLTGLALGGCFCRYCERAGGQAGLDWERIRRRLLPLSSGLERRNHQDTFELTLLHASTTTSTAVLAEVPELYQFLEFRVDSLTSFFSEIYAAVHAIRPTVDVRLNHYAQYPELMGLDLRRTADCFDSVRSSDYSEQTGDPARMEWKRGYLHAIRRAVGLEKYLLSAVSPRPKATPELVKRGILISAECGADALTIGHYDGAWLPCLRAIGEGLDEAGIEVAGSGRHG